MKIHEYQARELLSNAGVPVPAGTLLESVEAAAGTYKDIAGQSGTDLAVIKAQVHAGGRGKAGFVKLVRSPEETTEAARFMLSNKMVSNQTGPEGLEVKKLLVAAGVDIAHEYYLAITVDRTRRRNILIASREGGVEIEKVAEETPEKILKATIDPLVGPQPYQGRELAFKLGLEGDQIKQFTSLFLGLAKLFDDLDCSLLEINPLVITTEGNIHCLDAKVNIDNNALYRQKKIAEMHDPSQEDEREAQAAEFNLNYVALDGNIGCMVNGAGLAMGTMDLVKTKGGNPANFLDVGGGATKETVSEAFKIILSDKNVKAVLINIFGGIVSCATIADGIIGAVEEVGVEVPVVVRFEGNNAEAGRKRLADSGLNIIAAKSLSDAAEQAVEAAGGKA